MEILGMVCSPRKGGNTEIIVSQALTGARLFGAKTELITVADLHIGFCDGCESCIKTGKCRIDDDMQEVYDKLLKADGVIFGSPVYFWDISAQAKTLLDRTFAFRKGRRLSNKVVGAVVVARRRGASLAISTFHSFFTIHQMVPAVVGWQGRDEEATTPGVLTGSILAYADKKGDIANDSKIMSQAAVLGEAVVKTIQYIEPFSGNN